MKRNHIIIVSLILVVVLIILAICFHDKNNSNNDKKSDNTKPSIDTSSQIVEGSLIFEAQITEILDNEIEISVTNGNTSGFSTGETLILVTEHLKPDLYSNLKINDNISVEFDGIVMNSFPGRIGSIYNIVKIG